MSVIIPIVAIAFLVLTLMTFGSLLLFGLCRMAAKEAPTPEERK